MSKGEEATMATEGAMQSNETKTHYQARVDNIFLKWLCFLEPPLLLQKLNKECYINNTVIMHEDTLPNCLGPYQRKENNQGE